MPRRKAEYKFLGREKWDSQSDDGKIFLALFRERTVGNVRHAAPLDPVLYNFDSVVKYILRWVPELRKNLEKSGTDLDYRHSRTPRGRRPIGIWYGTTKR